jgi:perosamine synthetase
MIPVSKPYFDDEDLKIIQEPLKSGWVLQGKYVKEFEDMFCKWTGAKHAVTVSSGSTALHIAVIAAGVKEDDEVIVPGFTWLSTANCVEYVNAKPVFVDIDLKTFNIDVDKIEKKITSKTKAIIPVHQFGLCVDMDKITAIAKKHNLTIIEDAACAFGSRFKNKHSGIFGELGCFSFHPRKSITTGEGGMIVTDDENLAKLCRSLKDIGASKSDFQRQKNEEEKKQYSFLLSKYEHLGYNFRMTDIQAALGTTQMKKAETIVKGKQHLASVYDDLLKDLDWLQLPYKHKNYFHGYQSYAVLFKPEEPTMNNCEKLFDMRNKIMDKLEEKEITTRQGTHAPPFLDYYKNKYNYSPKDFPNSYIAEKCSIALPFYYGMSDEDIETVASELKNAYNSL